MTDFSLTRDDKHSGLWLRLKLHLEDMLTDARIRNDSESKTEQQTAALRGRIGCLKALLALGDDRPVLLTGDGEQPLD